MGVKMPVKRFIAPIVQARAPFALRKQVDAEDDGEYPRRRRERPGRVAEQRHVGGLLQHRAPRRHGIGKPEADIRQRRLRKHEGGHEQRRLCLQEAARPQEAVAQEHPSVVARRPRAPPRRSRVHVPRATIARTPRATIGQPSSVKIAASSRNTVAGGSTSGSTARSASAT